MAVTGCSTIWRSGWGIFVLASAPHTRHGQIDERYGRVLQWKGKTAKLRVESRGYRYELVSPIPVDVLPGRRVRSKAIPVVPLLARRPRRNRNRAATHDAADLTAGSR